MAVSLRIFMLGLSRVESHIRPLRRMVTGRADVYRVQSSSLRTGVKEIVTRFVHWRPGHDVSGDPVIRIRFDGATCRACPARRMCTAAQDAPRQLTVRTQAHHEAIQAARQRQETAELKAQYALRAGMESRLSQGVRRVDLRRSRYLGLVRKARQSFLYASAE
jgi:hypothetical protein